MLSPAELAQRSKAKLNYRTYHDYLYSRKILRPSNSSIKDVLLSDRFSYPEINRWVQITKWMNKNNSTGTEEINLPPCEVIETEKVASVIPKIIVSPPVKVQEPRPIAVQKKIDRWKYLSFNAGATVGSVNIKSDDDLNSEFELLFFKFSFSANYQIAKDLHVYGGIGLNNYLSVKFSSNAGKDETNEISPYWDYNSGMRKKFSQHLLSLQYDNMNFLLNQNKPSEFRLTPTRVDRIAVLDSFKMNKKFSLLASVGVFHPLFSQASGFDFAFGPSFEAINNLNIYLLSSFNELSKDEIKNTSQAFVLGSSYRF